ARRRYRRGPPVRKPGRSPAGSRARQPVGHRPRPPGEPGATWLHYGLVEREQMPLAMGGAGQEVCDVWRRGPNISQWKASPTVTGRALSHSATSSPRCGAVISMQQAPRLSAETGLPYTPAAGREMVSGTYRQHLTSIRCRRVVADTSLDVVTTVNAMVKTMP